MNVLEVSLRGDVYWDDIAAINDAGDVITPTKPLAVAGLECGMTSGKPSVGVRMELPGGKVAVVEVSLQNFLTAADALRVRFGDPRQ